MGMEKREVGRGILETKVAGLPCLSVLSHIFKTLKSLMHRGDSNGCTNYQGCFKQAKCKHLVWLKILSVHLSTQPGASPRVQGASLCGNQQEGHSEETEG